MSAGEILHFGPRTTALDYTVILLVALPGLVGQLMTRMASGTGAMMR